MARRHYLHPRVRGATRKDRIYWRRRRERLPFRNVLILGDSYMRRDTDPTSGQFVNSPVAAVNFYDEATGGSGLWYAENSATNILDNITGWLSTYADTVDTVVIHAGYNDLTAFLGVIDLEKTQEAAASIFLEVLAAGKQLIVAGPPPTGHLEIDNFDAGYDGSATGFNTWPTTADPDYEGNAYTTPLPANVDELRFANVTAFHDWLEVYVPAIGGKFADTWEALGGAGGIRADWRVDNIHLTQDAMDSIMAPVINEQLLSPDVRPTNRATVMRARPLPELMSVNDITQLVSFLDQVEDEWDSAIEVFWLDQEDNSFDTADERVRAGLKGTYTATVNTGSISYEATGLRLNSTSSLDAGFNITDLPNSVSVGYMIGACANPTQAFSGSWGGGDFGAASFNINHGTTDNRVTAKTSVAILYPQTEGANAAVNNVLEVQARAEGPNTTIDWYRNGARVVAGSPQTRGTPNARNFLIGGYDLGGTTFDDNNSTWRLLYITDGSTDPEKWNLAARSAFGV